MRQNSLIAVTFKSRGCKTISSLQQLSAHQPQNQHKNVAVEGTAHLRASMEQAGLRTKVKSTKPPPILGRGSGTVCTIYQLIVTLHLPN